MKHFLFILLALGLIFGFFQANAQNLVPAITNVLATADTANHRIDVTFDLADPESDPMEVWLQASADSGKSWIVPVDSVQGDAGMSISSGTGKMISWYYDPATLAGFGFGLTSLRLRVIADDHLPIDLQDIVDQVDSQQVVNDLLQLEGIRHRTGNLPHLEETKDSLEARLAARDLHPYRQGGTFGSYQTENVIGLASGTRFPRKTWMISGHFDSVAISPGADDNGSAVVTVLEAIRIISKYQTKHSVRYFFFDIEEAGLIGSKQYLASGVPPWEEMQGLLNMDGIGYYSNQPGSQSLPTGFNILFPTQTSQIQADSSRGNFINSIVNTASSQLDSIFVALAATYQPALKVISLETPGTGTATQDLRRSDHAPFWDEGVPAIFLSDGANFRNPNYHTSHDSVSTLDFPFLLKNIRVIVTMLAERAGLEHSATTQSNDVQIQLPLSRVAQLQMVQPELTIFPNPTSGQVHFRVTLPEPGEARIKILDHHGHLLHTLPSRQMTAGENLISWSGNLPPDQYVVALEVNGKQVFAPLVVVR
ncbi:MAG: M28 family peptidase [Bacteroidia bacterium]|nr:M28 family peptidase [Bacteroidia bacterium]